jgi:mannose-6-phosphate isomerase-like protein (cupin superfamily)
MEPRFETSHWTKRNFDDLEDRSPAEVPMRWQFSRNSIHSSQVGVSRFTYEPGARTPFGHRHREQEEVYVVVSGSGRAKLEVICVGGRRPKGGDSDRFDDFWPADPAAR